MTRPEVKSRLGWRPLGGPTPPSVDESDLFVVRNLRCGSELSIASERATADGSGVAQISLRDSTVLRGHLGLMELRLDGAVIGEVEILPDKLSAPAYATLRADLERVWAGLVFGEGPGHLRAKPPSAKELWERIERPVLEVLDSPRTALRETESVRRLEQVRRPSELTTNLLVASARGRPGRSRRLENSTTLPENALVGETLERLAVLARRDPDAAPLSVMLARLARDQTFAGRRPRHGIPFGTRVDRRYSQIEEVRRQLMDPVAQPTEGPGELRLGVKGMTRLYEYWVFLQVLVLAADLYGPPLEPGFSPLAVPLIRGRKRLELRAGTTVTFPGPIHVAFEPMITTGGSGWMGLELVGHPDPDRFQDVITPDVVVYRPRPDPWITIVDAKYVGRHWVERSAFELHAKYSRIRDQGAPAVRYVIAAHPHLGREALWAGYGYEPMVPGGPAPSIPLPRPRPGPAPARAQRPSPKDRESESLGDDMTALPVLSKVSTVVADQGWMHDQLGDTRIDLRDLIHKASGGASVPAHLVAPNILVLEPFLNVAERLGWTIQRVATRERSTCRDAICALVVDLVERGEWPAIITGDPLLISQLRARAGSGWQVFEDLDVVQRL